MMHMQTRSSHGVFSKSARCLDVFLIVAGGLIAHSMRLSALDFSDVERLLIAFNCVLALLLFPVFGVYATWRGKPLPMMLARHARVNGGGRRRAAGRIHAASHGCGVAAVVRVFDADLGRVHRPGEVRGARGPASDAFARLNQRTVAIVGAQGFARPLLAHLSSTPEQGFTPVCLLDTTGDEELRASGADSIAGTTTGTHGARLPVLNDIDEFIEKVRAEDINEV